jgi:hypothetical protein
MPSLANEGFPYPTPVCNPDGTDIYRGVFQGGAGPITPTTQRVNIATDQQPVPTTLPPTSVTGTLGALNAVINLAIGGNSTVVLDLFGTSVSTVSFLASIDGVNFFPVAAHAYTLSGLQLAGLVTFANTFPNRLVIPCPGAVTFRAITTAYTSGSVAATARAVSAASLLSAVLAGQNDLRASLNASASGGALAPRHIVSAATTNAQNVKASSGRVYGWSFANTNAAWRYVKLHNVTGVPTAGAGVVMTIAIPPNGLAQVQSVAGIFFNTGIGLTTVTGAADADATAVGLNDIVGDLFFA